MSEKKSIPAWVYAAGCIGAFTLLFEPKIGRWTVGQIRKGCEEIEASISKG